MPLVSYKCPNCGGGLKFDPGSQKLKCEYCMSEFSEEDLKGLEGATSEGQQEPTDRGETQGTETGAEAPEDTAFLPEDAVRPTDPPAAVFMEAADENSDNHVIGKGRKQI